MSGTVEKAGEFAGGYVRKSGLIGIFLVVFVVGAGLIVYIQANSASLVEAATKDRWTGTMQTRYQEAVEKRITALEHERVRSQERYTSTARRLQGLEAGQAEILRVLRELRR